MHHHETYMNTNFQQNRVCRSVITVHTIYSRTVVKSFFLEGQTDERSDIASDDIMYFFSEEKKNAKNLY